MVGARDGPSGPVWPRASECLPSIPGAINRSQLSIIAVRQLCESPRMPPNRSTAFHGRMSATASAIKPAGPEGVSRTQLLKERLGAGLRNIMKVAEVCLGGRSHNRQRHHPGHGAVSMTRRATAAGTIPKTKASASPLLRLPFPGFARARSTGLRRVIALLYRAWKNN